MNTVAILMSTYNGEKYLKEQIDSILTQKDVDITLIIRDDGSSDRTVEIIEEYLKEHFNIKLIKGENIGVGNSFMQLVYDTEDSFDYYAFSDQDDIWNENKISIAIKELKKHETALLYASNQELIGKKGESLGLRYPKDYIMHVELESEFQTNEISGCTFVFCKQLKKLLCEKKRRPSAELLNNRIHDVWVAVVASLYDGIIYDNEAHIKYRQHDNNVVGAFSRGFRYNIKEKLKKIKNSAYRNGRSRISYELCKTFPEMAVKYPIINCCKDGMSLSSKRYLLRNISQLKKYSRESYFELICKICFGLY